MNLNSNRFPKGLITLDGIFKFGDKAKRNCLNLTTNEDDHTLVTIANGKTLNLEKLCTNIEKEVFIKLCQEFNNVIT